MRGYEGKTCPGMTQFVFLENMNGAMGRLWGEYLELVSSMCNK
jgi:hypothetical protein